MFDQTFLQTPSSNRKPYSLGLSLVLQSAALAFLAVLPLLYSPGLPGVALRTLLVAPAPPTAPVVTRAAVPAGHVPAFHKFVFRPDSADPVTKPASRPMEEAAAQGIDFGAGTGDPNGQASSILNTMGTVPPPPLIVAKPPVPKAIESRPMRIGGTVAEANLIQRVQPVYPPLAKSARVSGTVEFSATISRDGLIENLQLLRGHPLLVNSARQAILQWRYKPTLLNGQPVEVITSILVTFTLN